MLTSSSNALEAEAQWPAQCCLTPVPSDVILAHIDLKTKKRYRQRAAEWSLPAGERIYCPAQVCSAWIPPSYIDTGTQSARCPSCRQKACTICRGPFHNGGDCPADSSIRATINLAATEGWKRCYSCHALVEHSTGCRHMTCRCKAQFCYVCGLRWRTCACTDAEFIRLQLEINLRRRERSRGAHRGMDALAAAAAAEDERQAIAEVEQFIRQEVEREARVAREERRNPEGARQRQQDARVEEITHRYHALHEELELLQNQQNISIIERHESEQQAFQRKRHNAFRVLTFRHASETVDLERRSAQKIEAVKEKYSEEYEACSSSERQMEDNYVADISRFWTGKPEHDTKVREARAAFRQDQEPHFNSWDSRQREKLQVMTDEEMARSVSLGLQHTREHEMAGTRASSEKAEMDWRKWTEMRWAQEVERERVLMLQELEQDEYAMGSVERDLNL